jgi:hypothetical protein
MRSRLLRFSSCPPLAAVAALGILALAAFLAFLHPPKAQAQSGKPVLVGTWSIEGAGYGFENAGNPAGAPQFDQVPTGVCVMRITHQSGRAFAGKIVCGGDETSAQLLTGAILHNGEIQMLIAEDLDSRSWCFAKLSADGDSLVIHGVMSSMEDPAVAKSPGIATMAITARLLP